MSRLHLRKEQMLRLVAAILDCLKFTLPFNISNVVQPNRALFHSLGGVGGDGGGAIDIF